MANNYGWLIAVLICVVASTISNFGLNLQKLALTMKQTKSKPPWVYRTTWFCGFLGITGGAAGDFAALAFGAQSIVAPLGSLTLVANVLMAPWVLKESVSKRDVYSTLLIVSGCVIAVAFASHKSETFTSEQLFKLYTRPQFIAYLPIVAAVIVAILLAIRYIERLQATFGSHSPQYNKHAKFHRFSYACVSGIAGAQSILFAKTTVTLIKDSANGGKFFLARGQSYGIIFSMILTVALQIYWLNCGLARWDAVNNVPVFQSFWITVSVIGGGVFYDEFSGFSPVQCAMFPFGIILTVIGVYYLTRREITARRRASTFTIPTDAKLLCTDNEEEGVLTHDVDVTCTEHFLGVSLKKLRVIVRDVFDSSIKRPAIVWTVTGFGKDASGATSELERSGLVHVGDILSKINGESTFDHWLTPYDVLRRLTHADRPVVLSFRPFGQLLRRPREFASPRGTELATVHDRRSDHGESGTESDGYDMKYGSQRKGEYRQLAGSNVSVDDIPTTVASRSKEMGLLIDSEKKPSRRLSRPPVVVEPVATINDSSAGRSGGLPVRRALSLGHHDEEDQHADDLPSSPLLASAETSSYAAPDFRGRAVSDYASAKSSPRLVASPPKSNPRRASVLSQFLHAVKPSWGGSSTGSHAGIGHHVAKKSALDPHEIDAPQLAADTHEMGIQLAPEDDEDSGNTDESDIELAAPREAATSASRAITTAHAQLYGVNLAPGLSFFMKGNTIYPTAIDKRGQQSPHILAKLVDTLTPRDRDTFKMIDRVFDMVPALNPQNLQPSAPYPPSSAAGSGLTPLMLGGRHHRRHSLDAATGENSHNLLYRLSKPFRAIPRLLRGDGSPVVVAEAADVHEHSPILTASPQLPQLQRYGSVERDQLTEAAPSIPTAPIPVRREHGGSDPSMLSYNMRGRSVSDLGNSGSLWMALREMSPRVGPHPSVDMTTSLPNTTLDAIEEPVDSTQAEV